MGPVFSTLIPLVVRGFLGLLIWAAQRGKPKADPETGTLLFRHHVLFRCFSYFSAFGIPLGITVLVIFNPPKKEGDVWAIVFLYALFAGLSAPLRFPRARGYFPASCAPYGMP